jgi:hypothetical protein
MCRSLYDDYSMQRNITAAIHKRQSDVFIVWIRAKHATEGREWV